MAAEAEDAGFDAVMLSEHVVLGAGADADGRMANPREYALPGNQDPAMPWPDSQVLLAAMAALTTGCGCLPPRSSRRCATRWRSRSRSPRSTCSARAGSSCCRRRAGTAAEYDALGVPFAQRGERLDEHLAAWRAAWGPSPASFHGRHYRFDDVYVEPKPCTRPDGVALHFGSSSLHERLIAADRPLRQRRQPARPDLGAPSSTAWRGDARRRARIRTSSSSSAARARASPTSGSVADLGAALASIPEQMAAGLHDASASSRRSSPTTPRAEVGAPLCREVIARVARRADRA